MRYVRKEFLSPCADESGSIVIQIETPRQKDIQEYHVKDGTAWMRASLKVNDCHKAALLDFDCQDQKSYEKRIAKLDKLLKEIQDMRNQYQEAWESSLRDVEYRGRQLEQEKIDKANAASDRAANYRGPR
ncbi:hypothetical protein PSPHG_CDS_0077 [Pseudomonas phage Psxphi15]